MSHDPQETVQEEEVETNSEDGSDEVEYITNISLTDEWLTFRNSMVTNMFNAWRNR